MVQVIKRTESQRKSTSEQFNEAFGQGLQALEKYQGMQQKKAANKSIQEQFGFDPTGMTDKQVEIGMQLAGQRQNQQAKTKSRNDLIGNIEGMGQKGQNLQESEQNTSDYYYDLAHKYAMAEENQLANQAFKKGQSIEKQDKEFNERIREKDAVKSLLRETGDYDEGELEDLSTIYDLPTARALNLKKKEPSPYEPTSQKLAAERTDRFITDVTNRGRSAEEKMRGLNEGWALHKAGGTGYKFTNTLADYFGNEALRDPASKGFNAAMKSQYHGMGDIVKGKVSDNEFNTFKQRIASAEDTPEAAEILMISAMMEAQINIKEMELLNQKRMEYYEKGESPPADFDLQVMNELRPYADMIMHQTSNRINNVLNPTKKNNENKAQFDEIFRGLL